MCSQALLQESLLPLLKWYLMLDTTIVSDLIRHPLMAFCVAV